MASAKQVNKRVRMTLDNIIRYQIITHCFISGITISDSELEGLLLLSVNGECDLSEFANAACDPKHRTKESILPHQEVVFKTPQTVRNFLSKAQKEGLILKNGTSRKKVSINPELQMQFEGNIVLDFKMAHIVT